MVFDTQSKGVNITGIATTVVKTGNCILDTIVFNKKVANGVVAIYDDTSAVAGSLRGTITMPATLLDSQQFIQYVQGLKFDRGLTIVTSVAAQDITIAFR